MQEWEEVTCVCVGGCHYLVLLLAKLRPRSSTEVRVKISFIVVGAFQILL